MTVATLVGAVCALLPVALFALLWRGERGRQLELAKLQQEAQERHQERQHALATEQLRLQRAHLEASERQQQAQALQMGKATRDETTGKLEVEVKLPEPDDPADQAVRKSRKLYGPNGKRREDEE